MMNNMKRAAQTLRRWQICLEMFAHKHMLLLLGVIHIAIWLAIFSGGVSDEHTVQGAISRPDSWCFVRQFVLCIFSQHTDSFISVSLVHVLRCGFYLFYFRLPLKKHCNSEASLLCLMGFEGSSIQGNRCALFFMPSISGFYAIL